MFSYCEGDTVLTKCDDEQDFIKTVHAAVEWRREAGYFIGIDGLGSLAIIEAFTRMGLADLLH